LIVNEALFDYCGRRRIQVIKMKDVKLEENVNLKNEFAPYVYEEWKTRVISDLKGADFDEKLITRTYEGISLKPLYTNDDIKKLRFVNSLPGEKKYVRGNSASGYLQNPWLIAQSIPSLRDDKINETIENDLRNGLTAIILPVNDTAVKLGETGNGQTADDYDRGGSILKMSNLNGILSAVDVEKYPLFIEAGFSSYSLALMYDTVLNRRNIKVENVKGGITSDPLAYLTEYGKLPMDFDSIYDEIAETVKLTENFNSSFKTIGVSAYHLNSAGANAVQETACAIAAAVEYIDVLTDKGFEAQAIIDRIKFKFGIGSFYFMEIAKLRAFRMLWNVVSNEYGVDGKAFIHAKTTRFNQTKLDPHVNILRTTTEAFSAILGGADVLETNSFDEVLGERSDLGKRIARSAQLILKEETHLDKLIDPAGGSFYVETLTNEIAEKSWTLFKKIQQHGGMFRALEKGFIHDEIQSVRNKREDDFLKGKNILVGTNKYINPKESRSKSEDAKRKKISGGKAGRLKSVEGDSEPENIKGILELLRQSAGSGKTRELAVEAYLAGAKLGDVADAIRNTKGSGIKIKSISSKRLAEPLEQK